MKRLFLLITLLFLYACKADVDAVNLRFDGVYVNEILSETEKNQYHILKFYANGQVTGILIADDIWEIENESYAFNLLHLMQSEILQKGEYERSRNKIYFILSPPDSIKGTRFEDSASVVEFKGQISPSWLTLNVRNQKTEKVIQDEYKFHKIQGLIDPSLVPEE